MKLIPILLLLSSVHTPGNKKDTPVLNIEVTNIRSAEGKIMVAIFDNKEHYLDEHYAIPAEAVVTQTGTLVIPVEIPFGDYAISAFHDVNDNGKLDTNGVGIPKEPYGFSNGKKGTFGPPSFKRALFSFSEDGQLHRIKM